MTKYICETPIVFITFNRPEESIQTFMAIREVKPTKLYFVSDGARPYIDGEQELVDNCRNLINKVDWDCEVIKVFSDKNLGCMRRIVTALSLVFDEVEEAIILEDDCLPNLDFFKFMEWGLANFRNDSEIGMISGSNLIAHKYEIDFKNGFSNFINIWGWATWRRIWTVHNPYLSMKEVKLNLKNNTNHLQFNKWQTQYWSELLKYTLYAGSTWDFQLQYTFFRLKLKSVYPKHNLIYNIGFSGTGTHTTIKVPEYVYLNKPINVFQPESLKEDFSNKVSKNRDYKLAREIWSFTLLTTLRLKLMNFIRFNF